MIWIIIGFMILALLISLMILTGTDGAWWALGLFWLIVGIIAISGWLIFHGIIELTGIR